MTILVDAAIAFAIGGGAYLGTELVYLLLQVLTRLAGGSLSIRPASLPPHEELSLGTAASESSPDADVTTA